MTSRRKQARLARDVLNTELPLPIKDVVAPGGARDVISAYLGVLEAVSNKLQVDYPELLDILK